MYGYSEVRATCAATSSLYIIAVQYQTYCQPDRKLQWVWISNLVLRESITDKKQQIFFKKFKLKGL